jgi:hypothetical protein
VTEHLGERERGAERNAAAVEALGERIEHPVAPAGEVEVVAEAAQQRLKGVAVRVDGPGQERLAVEHDVAGLDAVDWPNRRDPAVGERDRPSRREAALGQDEVGNEPRAHSGASHIRW